jgi:hypothetical protein
MISLYQSLHEHVVQLGHRLTGPELLTLTKWAPASSDCIPVREWPDYLMFFAVAGNVAYRVAKL